LGNFRFDYEASAVDSYGKYPGWDRHLSKPNMEIECDPQA